MLQLTYTIPQSLRKATDETLNSYWDMYVVSRVEAGLHTDTVG